MFEQHFGLVRNPFDGVAEGSGVFLGPHAADLLRRVNKTFAKPDSVLCVSGPVGSGKSTLVARALSALGRQHTIVRIGRLKLGPDEVLDYLLRQLGLKQMPAGTIQKISVFRSILEKLEGNDIRLFIVVEDAVRLGNVALQELEVLTATDSGVSDGANLVLMAETALKGVLDAPGLKRLKQRIRLHSTVLPMTAAETRAYVHHAIRKAGGEPEGVVTDDALAALHDAAAGIPRMVNNLLCSALESAAETGAPILEASVLVRTAGEEYGIVIDSLPELPDDAQRSTGTASESQVSDVTDEPVGSETEAAAAPADAADFEQDALPDIAAIDTGEHPIPELIKETLPCLDELAPETASGLAEALPAVVEPPVDQETTVGPAMISAPGTDVAATVDDEIPLLEPALEIPSAEADAAPGTEPLAEPAIETRDIVPPLLTDDEETVPALDEDLLPLLETELPTQTKTGNEDEIPTLYDTHAGIESPLIDESHTDPEPADSPAEMPAWDRESTLAELRPDLKALERAMAAAQHNNEKPPPKPEIKPAVEAPEEVPEITLDDSIRRKIDIAEAALKATQALEEGGADSDLDSVPDAGNAAEPDPGPDSTDAEMDRISAELARAKSIEDVDDKLAETLFGEEFSMIAAEVAASVGTLVDGDEDPGTSTKADEPIELSLADSGACETSHMANGDHDKSNAKNLERQFQHAQGTDAVEVSMETTPSGLNLSATQRLATVRALNAATTPAANSDARHAGANGKAPQAPDSIENQINVSITQTLMSLDPATIEKMQAAEAENEEKKGGFFGRFRRSRS